MSPAILLASVSVMLTSVFRSPARVPGCKCLQHSRIGKETITEIAEQLCLHNTLHIASFDNFLCRDVNLPAMSICIFDGGAVDHAIQPRPERIRHAHRARLACGVK